MRVRLRDLKLLEKNARYMTATQFNQLVENLRRDGALTTTPLVHKGVVLSGNHRVQAAMKAGIAEADVVELQGDVDASRLLAIQLSHNAITGQDDPNILAELYTSLDFDAKLYSGITDDLLKQIDNLPLASLGAGATEYQELLLTFLPEDANAFVELLKRLEKPGKIARLVASLTDFDRFFDTLVAVKEKFNVHNTAMAVRMMATLAAERLTELEANEHVPTVRADSAG